MRKFVIRSLFGTMVLLGPGVFTGEASRILVLNTPGTALASTLQEKAVVQWDELRSTEGNFVVWVPVPTSHTKEQEKAGTTSERYACSLDNGNIAYMLQYTEMPEGTIKSKTAEKILEDYWEGTLRGVQSKNPSHHRTTLSSHPAIVGTFETDSLDLELRIVLVRTRLYQVCSVTLKTIKSEANTAMTRKFIDSFKLLKED